MFVVIDEDKEIIAYHEEKRVVEKFVYNYNMTNKTNVTYKKIKKRYAKRLLKDKDDLYLIKYGSSYIQYGYYDVMEIYHRDLITELEDVKDILYKIIEVEYRNMSKKEIKHLQGSVEVIERLLHDEYDVTPSLDSLRTSKDGIERFRNEIY